MRRAPVMTHTEAYQHAIRHHAHLENDDLERVFEAAFDEARHYTMQVDPQLACDGGIKWPATSLAQFTASMMTAEMRRRGMIS